VIITTLRRLNPVLYEEAGFPYVVRFFVSFSAIKIQYKFEDKTKTKLKVISAFFSSFLQNTTTP
jgi:hypothetical protein